MQAKLLHLVKQPPIRYMQVSEPAKVWQKPMRVLDVQQCKCKQFGFFFSSQHIVFLLLGGLHGLALTSMPVPSKSQVPMGWMDEQSGPREPSRWPRPRPLTPLAGEGTTFVSGVVVISSLGQAAADECGLHRHTQPQPAGPIVRTDCRRRRTHLNPAQSSSGRNPVVPWSSTTGPCAPPASPS